MRKKDELTKEHTCMKHAHAEEMVFVLLSRDSAAPGAIRAWVVERIRLGKNVETDEQIVEALECAEIMEVEFRKWVDAYANEPEWYAIQVSGELYERLEQAAKERGKTTEQLLEEALSDPA